MMTPEDFVARTDVSRETMERLLAYDRLLLDWSQRHNLIARSTMEERWQRHFYDSWQLAALVPDGAGQLIDIGSGAGFPGLVLAALFAPSGLEVTLVESVGKKAAFLREAAAAMKLDNVRIENARIESLSVGPPDVITARALASLDKLLGYAIGIAGKNTTFIFPKGVRAEEELTAARKSWRMDVTRYKSATDPSATIFVINNLVSLAPEQRQ